MLLNELSIEEMPPGKHHVGSGTGLILVVRLNGGKQWVQRVMVNGKRREIGLGGYPVVSLGEALADALANKRIARRGGDPLEVRRQS